MVRDVFICHAGEDKEAVARPLATMLKERGLTVWLDEQELTVGDSLRRVIDRGLSDSKFGVVILSPSFFLKEWPNVELDALFARELKTGKTILPVWHDVDHIAVRQRAPLLADKLAVSTSKGLDVVADEVARAISASTNGPRDTSATRGSDLSLSGARPSRRSLFALLTGIAALLALVAGYYLESADVFGGRSPSVAKLTELMLFGSPRTLSESWQKVFFDQSGSAVVPLRERSTLKLLALAYVDSPCLGHVETMNLIQKYLSKYISIKSFVLSINPRDDSKRVSEFVERNDYVLTMLRGAPEQIAGVSRDLGFIFVDAGVRDGKETFDHSQGIALIDGKKFVGMFRYSEIRDTEGGKVRPYAKVLAEDLLDYIDRKSAESSVGSSRDVSFIGYATAAETQQIWIERLTQDERSRVLAAIERDVALDPGRFECKR
ncbi:TIR domain-containing protein [Ahniella affigens]|nr:TIR domain-containing protein [Ahniella affigens]